MPDAKPLPLSPCSAVVQTYVQRVFSSWQGVFWLLMALLWVAMPLRQHGAQQQWVQPNVFMAATFLTGMLALHLKHLILDAKTRLLPDATRPPLWITFVAAAAYLLGLPLLLHFRSGAPLLWTISSFCLIAAAVVHWVVRPTWFMSVLLGSAWVACTIAANPLSTIAPSHEVLVKVVRTTPSVAPLLVLMLGLWWIFRSARSLLQMNEESRGYTAIPAAQTKWGWRVQTTEQATRPWREPSRAIWLRFADPGSRHLDRLVRHSRSGSIWLRCRRWQPSGRQWFFPLLISLIVSIPLFLYGRYSSTSDSIGSLLMAMQMPLMFAAILPAMQYQQEWRVRANDLLKPVSREAYLREIGLCLALGMARNMAILMLIVLVCAAGAMPAYSILCWVSFMVCLGVCCFGLIVWIMRYRSTLAMLLPCGVIVLVQVSLAIDTRQSTHLSAILIVSAVLALAGLCLARDGYRRWLKTDLG